MSSLKFQIQSNLRFTGVTQGELWYRKHDKLRDKLPLLGKVQCGYRSPPLNYKFEMCILPVFQRSGVACGF